MQGPIGDGRTILLHANTHTDQEGILYHSKLDSTGSWNSSPLLVRFTIPLEWAKDFPALRASIHVEIVYADGGIPRMFRRVESHTHGGYMDTLPAPDLDPVEINERTGVLTVGVGRPRLPLSSCHRDAMFRMCFAINNHILFTEPFRILAKQTKTKAGKRPSGPRITKREFDPIDRHPKRRALLEQFSHQISRLPSDASEAERQLSVTQPHLAMRQQQQLHGAHESDSGGDIHSQAERQAAAAAMAAASHAEFLHGAMSPGFRYNVGYDEHSGSGSMAGSMATAVPVLSSSYATASPVTGNASAMHTMDGATDRHGNLQATIAAATQASRQQQLNYDYGGNANTNMGAYQVNQGGVAVEGDSSGTSRQRGGGDGVGGVRGGHDMFGREGSSSSIAGGMVDTPLASLVASHLQRGARVGGSGLAERVLQPYYDNEQQPGLDDTRSDTIHAASAAVQAAAIHADDTTSSHAGQEMDSGDLPPSTPRQQQQQQHTMSEGLAMAMTPGAFNEQLWGVSPSFQTGAFDRGSQGPEGSGSSPQKRKRDYTGELDGMHFQHHHRDSGDQHGQSQPRNSSDSRGPGGDGLSGNGRVDYSGGGRVHMNDRMQAVGGHLDDSQDASAPANMLLALQKPQQHDRGAGAAGTSPSDVMQTPLLYRGSGGRTNHDDRERMRDRNQARAEFARYS